MPRPTELAADARALYGPVASRPVAADMGDGALWIDPGAGHALYQVQSGNWVRIGTGLAAPAAPAGVPVLHGPYVVDYTDIPHDGDTMTLWTPQVGDVLLRLFPDPATLVPWDHGSLQFVAGRTVLGAPETRTDDFARADQSGWGTASDGHIWSAGYAGVSPLSISADRGVITADASGNHQVALLGPPLAPARGLALVVRWKATSDQTDMGPVFVVRAAGDDSAGYRLEVHLDGQVYLWGPGGYSGPGAQSWTGAASGTIVWTRLVVLEGVLFWRVWVHGSAEPGSWTGSFDLPWPAMGGHVGLGANFDSPPASVAFDQLTITSLAAGLAGPAEPIVLADGSPVHIQLAKTGGTDPTQGHVDIFALVARPVAP